MEEKRYTIRFTDSAIEDLSGIANVQAGQIMRKIARLEYGLHGNIKRLQNADYGYRLRMGDFRVLFDVHAAEIVIHRIGHRKHIYD